MYVCIYRDYIYSIYLVSPPQRSTILGGYLDGEGTTRDSTDWKRLTRLKFNWALDSRFQDKFSENLKSRLKPIEPIEFQSGPGFKIQDSEKTFLEILNLESRARLNFNRINRFQSGFKILRKVFLTSRILSPGLDWDSIASIGFNRAHCFSELQ